VSWLVETVSVLPFTGLFQISVFNKNYFCILTIKFTTKTGDNMANYYSEDCERWAKRFAAMRPGSQIIEIRPTGGQVFGPVTMPDGSEVSVDWHYHYAVLYTGMIYDEAHPQGIFPVDFKQIFQYPDAISYFPPI
jgi:hypothetical protein